VCRKLDAVHPFGRVPDPTFPARLRANAMSLALTDPVGPPNSLCQFSGGVNHFCGFEDGETPVKKCRGQFGF